MPFSTRHPVAGSAAALALGVLLAAAPEPAWANGMPQLNFASPYLLWQVVWGAVIFAVFYVLLSRSALPRVEHVLADRRQRIEGDLDTARRARDEADRAVDELRRARQDAAAQAQANIDRVVHEARQAAEVTAREMGQRLNDEVEQAETRIAASRAEAVARLPEIATETARALSDKLLAPAGARVDDDALGKAVLDSLSRAA